MIALARRARALAPIAVALAAAACGQATHASSRAAARHAPPCPQPLITGRLPASYLKRSAVIGPVAFYPAKAEYPTLRGFGPVSGRGTASRYASIDTAVTVWAIGLVTVSIPAGEREHVRLLFDRDKFDNTGYRLSDGSLSYTFVGCRRPYTRFEGGFIVTRPGCVELQVRIAGQSEVTRGRLRFGTRTCATTS